MAGCKPIIKDQAKGIPYKVLPWNKVSDMVKDLLVKEKITFIPQIRETIANGNMTITTVDGEFVNAENPEEKITRQKRRNYVAKHSHKFNRPQTHKLKTAYKRVKWDITAESELSKG